MRRTSENYNPFPRLREVDCRITFGVIDQNAKNAAISGNDAGFFPRYAQTVDGITGIGGKWASLEPDFWRLDGTYDIAPDNMDGVQTGWWSSDVSGADGRFENPPYIRYDFGAPLSTLGWTLHFDEKTGQYASEVLVEVFGADGSVLETLTFSQRKPLQAYRHYVGDYYGVRFTFPGTSEAFRRVRVVQVDFGLTQFYDRDTLGTVSVVYGAAIDGSALPSRELVFTFDNSDKAYNLLNPDGVYQYLQDGQIINAKLVIDGEAVDMGDFVFTSADASRSAILPTITAHDRAYSLDSFEFNGGRDEETALSAAVAEVLGVTGYDIPVSYGDGIAGRRVHMSVKVGTTVRKTLQQLAQAARCSAYIDRDGVLRFAELTVGEDPDGEITADELHDYSGVSISERVHGVRLTVSDDFRVGKDGTPGRQVYFYSGDESRAVGYANPCVADSEGQAVADWLFRAANMAKKYNVANRCDPAAEIGDTLVIADAYGNHEAAVVTGLDIRFGSSLMAKTEAVGI